MRGLATGNREGKADQREQQIYTPWDIVDVCLQTWPEGIALDPCSGPDSQIPALESWHGTHVDTGRRTPKGEAVCKWTGPGLHTPWRMRSYINMPYSDLELWLDKSRAEATLGITEQILLFPVRPNRDWWSAYMRDVATSISYLRPLAFVGHDQTFPAPLALVHTGRDRNNETTARFRRACRPLSTHVGGPLL